MSEQVYRRYTREKTWEALYCQAVNACYALVPHSTTNNSIWLLRCRSPEETQERLHFLLAHEQECAAFFASRQTPEHAPTYLKYAGEAVVLAKSSDYWRYHLADRPHIALVVAGLHDSYLHVPVWETSTNRRYAARETALKIGSLGFEQARGRGQTLGHAILLGALAAGDQAALAYLKKLPARTRRRMRAEADALQAERYRGRPLAFHTESERMAIGSKISAGLLRYHAQRRA